MSVDAAPPVPADGELAALLAGVLANPDDDVPRLAYAAALEARGDPRGEYIRVQCARVARFDPAVDPDLRRREAALFKEHGAGWAAPARACGTAWVFRRGFVDELTGVLDTVLASGGPLFAREPVRVVSVATVTAANAPELAAAPWVARLARLTMRGGMGDAGAAQLATSPHLGAVASINLGSNELGAAGLAALLEGGALAGCTTLCLTANSLGDEGVAVLAGSPELAHIHTLYLAANEITDAGVKQLAESEYATGLVRLCLGSNEIGDDGAIALATSSRLAGLRKLELCRADIGEVGARAFAEPGALPSLRALDLSGNGYAWRRTALAALQKRFGARLKA